MTELELMASLAEHTQNASVKESFMLAVLIIIAAGFLAEKIIAWRTGRRAMVIQPDQDREAKVRKALDIVTKEDADGLPLMLSLPRLLRDFTKAIERLDTSVRHLANHNSELLQTIHQATLASKKASEDAKDAAESARDKIH